MKSIASSRFASIFICIASFFISFSAFSADPEEAKQLLERLSKSLRQVNFNTSFVVVKNNQAEPYHWLHGIVEEQVSADGKLTENIELEILALLNGPRRDILRINNTVSYIEPEYAPYSISSEQISGPIPSVFGQDISILENNYHFVSVGKNRILGRAAQLIRIVPKDSHRYGYWLWLDQESSLLLKLAVITREGKLLEQIQFTHLDITDTISENLKQLQLAELPQIIDVTSQQEYTDLMWQVNWLPNGFEPVKSDRHRINNSKQAVEFMLFNDGLVDISVYVNPSKEKQRAIEFASDGATIVLSQVISNIEVSVVGKIPLETAEKIVNSVTFNRKLSVH
ncbi:MucB/RseB C-terminal domain-containing protein [Colwellia sp. E150_009]